MKILLIFPDIKNVDYADFAPLGILYIASVLRMRGHQVIVIDNLLERNNEVQLKYRTSKFSPDIIGISCNVLQASETYRLARLLKNEQVKIIVGGPHATIMFQEILADCCEIDYCIIGEGEDTIIELVQYLNDKEGNIEDITGIAFRKDGVIKRTAPRQLIKDLDYIPHPAYDLIDLSKYRSFPVACMVTSRGCPFECIFCSNSVFGRTNRQRSVKNILGEIELLINKYNCKAIDFHDDTFNLKRNRAYALAEALIERRFNKQIKWSCEARVDRPLFDRELIKRFKESGCRLISFGIESGSNNILKNIRKGITKEEVKRAIELCKEAGINTRAFFMVGNLGENADDVFTSITFARELSCNATQFTICTPFPGSVFYITAKEEGWIKNLDYSLYNEKNALIDNESLKSADLIALKNAADFIMLLNGNNLEIFAASLLTGNKRTIKIKKDSLLKILIKIPQVKHPIRTAVFLLQYLIWLISGKKNR